MLLLHVFGLSDLLRQAHVEEEVELALAGSDGGLSGLNSRSLGPLRVVTRLGKLRGHFVGNRRFKGDPRNSAVHLFGDHFLPHVSLGASRDALGAPEVIMTLLCLGRDGATALAAQEKTTVKVWLKFRSLRLALARHDRLRVVEKALGDYRLVLALERLPVVEHDAVKERVFEHRLKVRGRESLSCIGDESDVAHNPPQFMEGVVSRGVELKSLPHQWGLVGINDDGTFVFVIEVANGRLARPNAIAEFLPDAALYVLRQIIDVVFALRESDIEHELSVGAWLKAKRGKAQVSDFADVHKVDDAAPVHAVARETIRVPCD